MPRILLLGWFARWEVNRLICRWNQFSHQSFRRLFRITFISTLSNKHFICSLITQNNLKKKKTPMYFFAWMWVCVCIYIYIYIYIYIRLSLQSHKKYSCKSLSSSLQAPSHIYNIKANYLCHWYSSSPLSYSFSNRKDKSYREVSVEGPV